MPLDTDAAALAIQQDIFRRMSPEQRLRLALEMSQSMRDLALAGLRQRRPELSEEQLVLELRQIMYGPKARS